MIDPMAKAKCCVAIAIALFMTPGCHLAGNTGPSKAEAEKQAKRWAKEMGINVKKISCNGSDSDGDGYVSCSFNVDGVVATYECAGAYNLNNGCRVPKVHVGRR